MNIINKAMAITELVVSVSTYYVGKIVKNRLYQMIDKSNNQSR